MPDAPPTDAAHRTLAEHKGQMLTEAQKLGESLQQAEEHGLFFRIDLEDYAESGAEWAKHLLEALEKKP